MYGAIWRKLPGPTWLKIIEVAIILFAIIALLFNYGFPWINDFFKLDEITIN